MEWAAAGGLQVQPAGDSEEENLGRLLGPPGGGDLRPQITSCCIDMLLYFICIIKDFCRHEISYEGRKYLLNQITLIGVNTQKYATPRNTKNMMSKKTLECAATAEYRRIWTAGT